MKFESNKVYLGNLSLQFVARSVTDAPGHMYKICTFLKLTLFGTHVNCDKYFILFI